MMLRVLLERRVRCRRMTKYITKASKRTAATVLTTMPIITPGVRCGKCSGVTGPEEFGAGLVTLTVVGVNPKSDEVDEATDMDISSGSVQKETDVDVGAGKVEGRTDVNAEAGTKSPIVTIWPRVVRKLDAAA